MRCRSIRTFRDEHAMDRRGDRRPRHRLRHRRVQPAHPPAQHRARRMERHRRAIASPHRPRAQPGRGGEGLRRARARPVRGRRQASRRQHRRQRRRRPGGGRARAQRLARPVDRAGGGLPAAQGRQELPGAAGPVGDGRGPDPDGAPLLQRRGAQPQHQHPVVPGADRGEDPRLQGGAVLRARGSRAGRGAAGFVPRGQVMTALARLALAIALVLAALDPAAAVERILRFVSDVTVEQNGDLAVTETIAVQAEGNQIRRGILRDFPTTYRRRDGARVVVDFDVQSVTRDGAPEAWTTEHLSNGVRVRIGSADRMIGNGRHEYVIRYRTNRQIGFFADYDELYWNATGTGWTFAIDEAEARITLPEAVPFRQSAFYTGPQDARGQDARIVEQRPGRIVFRTTRPLPARNGLTVAVAWQKGLVTPPDAAQKAGWLLRDNLALAVALVALLVVIAYYVFAWLVVGRDPRRGTIIPLFGPPEGMSAAGVRYVDKMGFDNRAFAAAIIDLGVNGHIKLTDHGRQTQIERRDGGKPVGGPEQALTARLFSGSARSLLLTQTNHEKIGRAKDALKDGLEALYRNKLFTNNYLWSALGVVAVVIAVAAIAAAVGWSYGTDNTPGAIAGMLVPIIPVVMGAGLLGSGWRLHSGGRVQEVLGIAVIVVGTTIGLAVMYFSSRGVIEVLPGLVPAALAALAALAFGWLQAPTRAGRKVMDHIDGFREYLSVAEEERLEYLNPPEKTPELFERFLPYAVALDVENSWAKRFTGVLAAAAAAGAAGAAASTWYSGDRGSDPVSFADRVGGELAGTIASASTAPGSSDGGGGSSGGGSSGGGGGGGGGSGW